MSTAQSLGRAALLRGAVAGTRARCPVGAARARTAPLLAARLADLARRELALHEPASARRAELRGRPGGRCAGGRYPTRRGRGLRPPPGPRARRRAGDSRRTGRRREARDRAGERLSPASARIRVRCGDSRVARTCTRESRPRGAPSRAALRCRGAALAAAQHRARRRRRAYQDQERTRDAAPHPAHRHRRPPGYRRLSEGHRRGRCRCGGDASSSITSSTAPRHL